MPTKLPPIMLGVTLKVPLRRFKKKLEDILSGDERRRMKVTQSAAMYVGPSNYLIRGPPTIFEKMSGVAAEYTYEDEYVPKEFPGLNPALADFIAGPPKILNRGKKANKVNRAFYIG